MDEPTYHEMNTDYADTNPHEDVERQEKIRRLEQLSIRPAITVYQDAE